ncbi:MAG TPA: hypothetical protein VFE24_05280 [Pirellulales bacterium]|jgi:hypothetical protein|nr:hypothetical protein [Pirellulales bacterium]
METFRPQNERVEILPTRVSLKTLFVITTAICIVTAIGSAIYHHVKNEYTFERVLQGHDSSLALHSISIWGQNRGHEIGGIIDARSCISYLSKRICAATTINPFKCSGHDLSATITFANNERCDIIIDPNPDGSGFELDFQPIDWLKQRDSDEYFIAFDEDCPKELVNFISKLGQLEYTGDLH